MKKIVLLLTNSALNLHLDLLLHLETQD